MLKGVTVTGQRSAMKLEVDRKTFDVAQLIGNAGQSASEVLDNIPSVEVDNDGNVSLRGNSSVEVWINGKASGLTTDNRAQILQQLPAETIESIEVNKYGKVRRAKLYYLRNLTGKKARIKERRVNTKKED